jgi:hypothetical protein
MVTLILLILAAVFFAIATFNGSIHPRVSPLAAGLLCMALAGLWPLIAR